MVAPLSRMPALPIALGWIAGILLWIAGYGWIAAAICALFGIFLIIKRLHYLAFALYAAAAGWAVAWMHQPVAPPDGIFDGYERVFSATVSNVSTRPTGQTLVLIVDSVATRSGLRPCTPFKISAGSLPDWSVSVGTKLRISTVLEPLDLQTDFPHDRDMRLYNLRKGVVAQCFLEEGDITDLGNDNSLAGWLFQRREDIVRILARSDLSDEAYGLIAAITVGYGDELDNTMRENFRAAGIAHALALSGFHVGIIILLVSVALFPMRAWYGLRRLRLAIALVLIWFYAAMVGMPESVVRAVVMLSIILLSKIFGSATNSFNSLCAAVAIILAVSPYSLFSTGFQLSVAAVAGILALSGPLNPFDPKHHIAYRLAMLVTVPVGAVCGTFVVTAATFHRMPLLFGISNIAVSFLLPPLMLAGIGVIVTGALGLKALWLCSICDRLTWVVEKVADTIASMAYAELSGIFLTSWQIAAIALAMVAVIVIARCPLKKVIGASCAVIVLCIAVIITCRENIPPNEAFIVNQSGNTPVVIRDGGKVTAVFTCHPDRLENARMRFEQRMADWFESRGVDSVVISTDTRSPLTIGGRRIMLVAAPGRLDSIEGKIDYAVICSRFRGSIGEVECMVHPDTIVLSRDLSLRRAVSLRRDASLPLIDLRHIPVE